MQDGSISRRNFLRGVAVGAGTMAIGASGLAYAKGGPPGPAPIEPLALPTPVEGWQLNVEAVRKSAWNWYFGGGG